MPTSLQTQFADVFAKAGINYSDAQGAYDAATPREGPYIPPDGKYTVELTSVEPSVVEFENKDTGAKESAAKFTFYYAILESLNGNSETIGKAISDQLWVSPDQSKNERTFGIVKFRCQQALGAESPDLLQGLTDLAEKAVGSRWEVSVVTAPVKSGSKKGEKRTNIYVNKFIPST